MCEMIHDGQVLIDGETETQEGHRRGVVYIYTTRITRMDLRTSLSQR